MAPTQKRRRRASKQTDDTDDPTVDSSEEQNNGNSTAPSATPVATETTDEDQLGKLLCPFCFLLFPFSLFRWLN
jgi:hypothetical protein